MHRILADACDSRLVFPVGKQIGDNPGGPAHREPAGHLPLVPAQRSPPSQPQVAAARLAAAGHIELMHAGDNVAQPEGVSGRTVTGHRAGIGKPQHRGPVTAQLQPRPPERIKLGIRRAARQPVHPCRPRDELKRSVGE